MATYRLFADVTEMTPSQRLSAARRIKRLLEIHSPFKHRTWRLSTLSYVTVWSNGVLEAGSRAPYASYLNEGTKNRNGSTRIKAGPYVERALSTVLGKGRLIYVDEESRYNRGE